MNRAPLNMNSRQVSVANASATAVARTDLHDQQREQYIKHAGFRLVAAYARWKATGCHADRAAVDNWRQAMERAIKGRSAAQIAKLERERGL